MKPFCIKPANGRIRPAVQIASSLGIETKYTERDEIDGADGITLPLNGKPCIFVANDLTTEEKRLTLTHELAHIVLGHLLSDDRFSVSYEQQEFEAETLGFILYNFLYGIDGGRIYRKDCMNPNSLKNLIPNSERTAEELSKIGRKGGIASGKERRRQATMKAYVRKRLKDMYIAELLTEQEYEDFKKWQRYRQKKERQRKL